MIRDTVAATWKAVKMRHTLTYVVLGTLVLALCLCDHIEEIAIKVSRREKDMYGNESVLLICNEHHEFTYLVEENQCVSNETLFDGKR